MKMVVDSKKFAECMKKISPAVEVTKDKKGSMESSIQLMLTKKKLEDGYFGIAVAYDEQYFLRMRFWLGCIHRGRSGISEPAIVSMSRNPLLSQDVRADNHGNKSHRCLQYDADGCETPSRHTLPAYNPY